MTKWRVLEPRGFASVPGGGTQRIYVPRPDLARDTATGCWRAVIAELRMAAGAPALTRNCERFLADELRADGWVVERMPEGGA